MPPKKLAEKNPSPKPASAKKGPSLPSSAELESIASKKSSPEEKLQEAAAQAELALNASKQASSLRTAAAAMKDPKKREQMLTEAYNKEVEAHGNSKMARMLSSGVVQGGMGGGGIGMAVGAGLGTVVGTVVGTVASVPTTALGTLVGMGVGGIHGPWIKLKKIGKKGDDEEGEGSGKEGEGEEFDEENVVPDPEVLRKAADEIAEERKKAEKGGGEEKENKEKARQGGEQKKERKKPRKIEVRNKKAAAT